MWTCANRPEQSALVSTTELITPNFGKADDLVAAGNSLVDEFACKMQSYVTWYFVKAGDKVLSVIVQTADALVDGFGMFVDIAPFFLPAGFAEDGSPIPSPAQTALFTYTANPTDANRAPVCGYFSQAFMSTMNLDCEESIGLVTKFIAMFALMDPTSPPIVNRRMSPTVLESLYSRYGYDHGIWSFQASVVGQNASYYRDHTFRQTVSSAPGYAAI
jgi:hypothetical protein